MIVITALLGVLAWLAMQILPGTEIINRESAPPRSAPTDTGVWFVTGIAEKGPLVPVFIKSLSEFVRHLGERVSSSVLYDAAETFFREGGARMYVSRVVGPAATVAFHVFNDGAAAASLRVEASSVGAWGNKLNVEIAAGANAGEFVIVVTHDDDGELDRSPSLVDKTAALAWGVDNRWITLLDQASPNDPAVVAAAGLAGGADDLAGITDDEWNDALALFTRDLGPGQVSAPGRTTDTAHDQLLAHAAANRRVAYLDGPDTAAVATLTGSAAALRDRADLGDRFGGLFAPWAVIPGTLAGTTRVVPYSAVEAGISARNDGQGLSPNTPAAGENGRSRFAIDLTQSWGDADRETLNDAGVNVAQVIYGGVRTYGFRTLVDSVENPNWRTLSNARLYVAIAAAADVIAERFVLAELDGQRRKVNEFGGVLAGMLLPYWTRGSLYGQTPEEAFAVDVGEQVNTDATLAAGELHAVLALRMSPFAERVILEIVKVAPSEAVA